MKIGETVVLDWYMGKRLMRPLIAKAITRPDWGIQVGIVLDPGDSDFQPDEMFSLRPVLAT